MVRVAHIPDGWDPSNPEKVSKWMDSLPTPKTYFCDTKNSCFDTNYGFSR